MHVFRALLYLRLMSLHNVLRSQLRRMRQPKYLVGAAAGAAYFWFFLFRKVGPGSPNQVFSVMFGEGRAELFAAAIMTLFLLITWITPGDKPGLAFTEAEVAFLFPAPLSRRQLIHYKLISGLMMTLFGAVFFTLLSSGTRGNWLGALRHLGAWWSINAILSLHNIAAALTITRLSTTGFSTGRRRLVILSLILAVVVTAAYFINRDGWTSLQPLLWPARLAVRPFLADSLAHYLLALVPAFGLVALHYFWIHRLETPFEEASIAQAQKLGERIARLRSGKGLQLGGKAKAQRGPFHLSDRLPVEAAFLWKNLLAAPAWLNRKIFFGVAALIYFGITWLQHRPDFDGPKVAGVAAGVSLVMLVYLLVFGPQLARNDLRGDIMNADMLKAYPLPGWRMVLGSLLAPTVILTGIAWLLLFAAGLALPAPGEGKALWFTPQFRIATAAALAVIMPALCAVQLLVPNAATLLFPAWAQTARSMGGGMDVMGQRMIFFVGQIICLIVALLPALALGGGTIFLTQWLIGLPAAIVLAVVPVLAVFIGEIWLGVWWLGQRFEKLDLTSELRP